MPIQISSAGAIASTQYLNALHTTSGPIRRFLVAELGFTCYTIFLKTYRLRLDTLARYLGLWLAKSLNPFIVIFCHWTSSHYNLNISRTLLELLSDTECGPDQLADNTKIGWESTYDSDPRNTMFKTQPPSLIVNHGGHDDNNPTFANPHQTLRQKHQLPSFSDIHISCNLLITLENGLAVKTIGRTWVICPPESNAMPERLLKCSVCQQHLESIAHKT
jgi:hypothetical protein